jgi:hypothetical protein
VAFREQLEDRLQGFNLELALEKTRCIEFGRHAREHARKKGQKLQECSGQVKTDTFLSRFTA